MEERLWKGVNKGAGKKKRGEWSGENGRGGIEIVSSEDREGRGKFASLMKLTNRVLSRQILT